MVVVIFYLCVKILIFKKKKISQGTKEVLILQYMHKIYTFILIIK